ncbi:MAG TPA: TonB-dependent receptor [Bryobacteraceae bacterium]|nr:TonB-dependent receptor [Bryobacteraceae bacterium]
MAKAKTHKTLASLVAGIACLAAPRVSPAAVPLKVSGSITGVVRNSVGVPQMGAAVLLYNRQERSVGKVLSDSNGQFKFLSLIPDVYSIKVSLAAFFPAVKKDIVVQPGMQSVLAVNLSSLFSTIQLAYPPIENGSLVTDDWKWVLRTANSTRPVMRFAGDPLTPAPDKTVHAAAFSDTRGILRVSAGEGTMATGVATEADLGTAFALATSLYGSNNLQVSGNVGYGSQNGVPTAAFRTSYSRNLMGGSPELSLTMRQMFLPGRLATSMSGSENALPMLRTMSAGFDDQVQLSDDVTLHYGSALDYVSFLDHLNYISPYARLTYSLSDGSQLELTFTSGNARPDLNGQPSDEADLQRNLNALGMFPRVSLRGTRPEIQRGTEYEITYSRKAGSRTYSLSAYHEAVTNAALTLVAPAGLYGGGDILPDVFSGNSIFDAGNFESTGYTAAVTQNLGEHFSATLMYGGLGALVADRRDLVTDNPDELRSMIREGQRHAATARITATVPGVGTHFSASYQYTEDNRWAMPGNLYSTQSFHAMPGLNIFVRQPIPGFGKRVEATIDFKNMLAQGYLPLGMYNGQRVMLVQYPRCVRGGLAFIF